MGEYEPDDSRDVTLRQGHEPGGIERTGPREGETRTDERVYPKGDVAQKGDQQQPTKADSRTPRQEYDQYEVNQADNVNKQSKPQAQMAYGNARDESAQQEQDVGSTGLGNSLDTPDVNGSQPGDISSNPAERAEADAERPLGKN